MKIELLVSTMKLSPEALSASMNSWAPGIGTSSWTSTPSMSVSQVWTSRVCVMAPIVVVQVDAQTSRLVRDTSLARRYAATAASCELTSSLRSTALTWLRTVASETPASSAIPRTDFPS